MKTKNIFKTLAAAMLLPAVLLTTACSSDDDLTDNGNIANPANTADTENPEKSGYELPVTVSVTRQGDEPATRATYNESTKKLEFSTGDKLFVRGEYNDGGTQKFAGTLDYVSDGKFSGTVTTETEYSGTMEAMLASSSAILLPDGYDSMGFFTKEENAGYNAEYSANYDKAFATSKATAVEQLSMEAATYSSGYALTPQNAILNFTITGLAASTSVAVAFTGSGDGDPSVSGSVTTNASGTATFAIGVVKGTDLNNCTLTVGGKAITLVSSSTVLAAGKIYNIKRAAPARTFADATTSDVGKVIGADGVIYATKSAAQTAGTTASGIIAYVGTAGSVDESSATYKGLALALTDANNGSECAWHTANSGTCVSQNSNINTALGYMNGIASTNTLVSDGHTHAAATAARTYSTARPDGVSEWFLPSIGQWNKIVNGLTGTSTAFKGSTNNTFKAASVSTKIKAAGGTAIQADSYWSSTEKSTDDAWEYYSFSGAAYGNYKTDNYYVRAAFAF